MRIPIIAGNWKMNTTVPEAEALASSLLDRLRESPANLVETIICPPFISLAPVSTILKGSRIRLGAQNCYCETKGAFTGEISPTMLAPLCQYVILGHSERRSLFKEDDSIINRKVHTALAAGLKVILCVGETLEDRQQGRTSDLVISQLMAGLDAVSNLEDIVIAYEPVWAIGTGQAASGHQANHVVTTLRSLIRSAYSPEAAEGVRILYGGSVTASNASEYLDQPDIDGALVGGASLKVEEFTSIAKKATPGLAI